MKRIRWLIGLGALVGIVALSGAVAACAGGGGGESAVRGSEAATVADELRLEMPAGGETAAPTTVAVAGTAAAPTEAPPAEVLADLPVGGALDTRVIQTASLTLTVPKGRFEETIDRARQLAAALGGFVTSSSAVQGEGERLVRGTLVLRVPQRSYAQAMSELAKLGQVKARDESGTDVSQQYVDLEARRRHLEAVERQLLEFLRKTTTVADALIVQDRLNNVQLQLEEVRGQLRYLDDQTSYSTISLSVAERGVPVASGKDGGWGITDAWHAAARGFVKVVGGVLVGLATAGPILAVLALAFLGWRLRRRRAARRLVGPATP